MRPHEWSHVIIPLLGSVNILVPAGWSGSTQWITLWAPPQPNGSGHPRNVPGCDWWQMTLLWDSVGPWDPNDSRVGIHGNPEHLPELRLRKSFCVKPWCSNLLASNGFPMWNMSKPFGCDPQPWTGNLHESFMYVLFSRCRSIRTKPSAVARWKYWIIQEFVGCLGMSRLPCVVSPSFMQTWTLPVQALLDHATNCALQNLNLTLLFSKDIMIIMRQSGTMNNDEKCITSTTAEVGMATLWTHQTSRDLKLHAQELQSHIPFESHLLSPGQDRVSRIVGPKIHWKIFGCFLVRNITLQTLANSFLGRPIFIIFIQNGLFPGSNRSCLHGKHVEFQPSLKAASEASGLGSGGKIPSVISSSLASSP